MKIILINGIEIRTETTEEAETVLRWLTAEPEFSVPTTHSGLRVEALGEVLGSEPVWPGDDGEEHA